MSESTLTIGLVLPDVLGTYGDGGNAHVIEQRARRRGIDAKIIPCSLTSPLPTSCDIYTIGGGEDLAQMIAVGYLQQAEAIEKIAALSTPTLVICAGLQVLGHFYVDAHAERTAGVGILDVITLPQGLRSIGELVSTPLLPELTHTVTGFENHGGATLLGPAAQPFARVITGSGNAHADLSSYPHLAEELNLPAGPLTHVEYNGKSYSAHSADGMKYDGVISDGFIATYMHGPALARNPQLADFLLARALGVSLESLEPVEIDGIEELRHERFAAAGVAF